MEHQLDRPGLTQAQRPEQMRYRRTLRIDLAWVLMGLGLLAFWVVVGAMLLRAIGVG